MPDLRLRNRQPELMDDPALAASAHAGALRGLARINYFSRSAASFWRPVRQVVAERERPLRLLDVATGAGDVPIHLAHFALRSDLPVEFAGCDVSPRAVEHARRSAWKAGVEIDWFQRDVLTDGVPAGYDILTCALFLHHLSDASAVRLLADLRRKARVAVLVNDLRRSRAGYWLALCGTRLLSRSHVVHVDGPRSVQAAFSVREVGALAEQAGMTAARITTRWPYRFLLEWHVGA